MEEYTTVGEIGRGGQAVVYEVKDNHGMRYAKKILTSDSESAIRRFEREIRLSLKISHKNIVPILSSDTSNDMNSYIMPLADGNLREYLNERSGEVELWVFKEILDGVKAVHDGGTIHRDLNPNNILLFAKEGENLYVAITDFGLGVLSERDSTTLTSTHGMGTYGYCSPEQLRNAKDVDWRTDIYSLGVILSNILTGSSFGTVEIGEIPEKYRHIVKRSCDPDRAKRYQSVDELLEAIGSIENGAYDRPKDTIQREVELTKRKFQYLLEGTKNIVNIYIQNLSDQSLYKDNLPDTEFIILKTMIDKYPSEFETIFSKYDEYASKSSPYDYDYFDTIADLYENVFNLADSDGIKSIIIHRLPIMGNSSGQWHVGKVFARILSKLDDPGLIDEVYDLFKKNTGAASFCMGYCDEISLPSKLNEFRILAQTR